MTRHIARWLMAVILFAASLGAAAQVVELASGQRSATLENIRQRGAIVVGVKADYPPFGTRGASGDWQGLELDMARAVADRLGVGLRLVPVTGANRLQRLEEGAVDVLIATMGDTAERRRVATVVEPNYYASGVTLMVRPETRLRDWAELRGHTVCAVQGSYFNRPMSQRHLLTLLNFNTARDAKLALRDGRCIGYLFDNTAIWADLREPAWAGYHAPLAPAMAVPWAVALARHESGSVLERWLGDLLAEWHRNGFLQERERAWGLPASSFLADERVRWQAVADDGQPVCRRGQDGQWPAACRHRALLTADDVDGLHQWGLALRELTGWDLSFVYDDFDRRRLLGGLALTVGLMIACVGGSLVLGGGGALIAQSRWRLFGAFARAAAAYGRMTPPLLQMYLLFFGLGGAMWAIWGLSLPAWAVAVVALSGYAGASVMAALMDASRFEARSDASFRLRWRTLPRVYGHAAGSITASLVNVCKATMMASVLAVPELLSVSTAILSDRGNVKEVMNMLLLAYLVLIALAVRLLGRLERWLSRRAEGSATAAQPAGKAA